MQFEFNVFKSNRSVDIILVDTERILRKTKKLFLIVILNRDD